MSAYKYVCVQYHMVYKSYNYHKLRLYIDYQLRMQYLPKEQKCYKV